MRSTIGIFTIIFIIGVYLSSCRKDNYFEGSDANLKFSKDTVFFDTVFSGIGSATRFFIVYNSYDLPVLISDIRLYKGEESSFRINVNGIPGNQTEGIEIAANDSIFVFVDVTIDPANDELVEYDEIVFTTNGNRQAVTLSAIGQDVHFLEDSVIQTQTWVNDKPYLIYNSIALDEDEVLTIEEGVHIYSHRNSKVIVLGTLIANGTYAEPIIFESDRLKGHSSIFFENDTLDNYEDVPGQWSGIWLTKFSKNNSLNYTVIKNAVVGIQVDSVQSGGIQLSLHNSKIEHHSFAGIYAQESSIFATNCLFTNCGYYDLALTRGGNYEFYHCTIGNYWSGARSTPSVYLNNYFIYGGTAYIYPLNNAYFGNCIIHGNNETEIQAEKHEEGEIFNYMFENCLLKVDPQSGINTSDPIHFKNNLINSEPGFVDRNLYDFSLSESSSAINHGSRAITNLFPGLLNYDLNSVIRISDENPDVGAYEFQ
jgi:hypothetical protein